jgi:SAM-dependent methyltransferase
MSAAEVYAARVDAVIAQRTRLRGPQPPGDLFGALPPDHPLLSVDARRPLEPNLEIVASYVEPDDVIVDVGGGAGRYSLPLALRCREVVNVDPSAAMLAGFEANARKAEIANVRVVQADWLDADPPRGSLALVNHVTYLTRDIVAFVQKLEVAASRRVLITVNSPPPPSWNRELFRLVYDEAEEIVPGHVELVNVLWEMGIEPDVRMLPGATSAFPASPTRETAIQVGLALFPGDQWALWPLGPELEARVRQTLDARFDELFTLTADGYVPGWPRPGREVLITWEPRRG